MMQGHTCDERCTQCAVAAALSAHLPSCRAQRSLSALLAMSTELHAAIAACMASRRSMTSNPCEYNGAFHAALASYTGKCLHRGMLGAAVPHAVWLTFLRMQATMCRHGLQQYVVDAKLTLLRHLLSTSCCRCSSASGRHLHDGPDSSTLDVPAQVQHPTADLSHHVRL